MCRYIFAKIDPKDTEDKQVQVDWKRKSFQDGAAVG
jgi:hypothetical protein